MAYAHFLRPAVNYSAVCSLMRRRLFALGNAHSGTEGGIRTHTDEVLRLVSLPLDYLSICIAAPRSGFFVKAGTSGALNQPSSIILRTASQIIDLFYYIIIISYFFIKINKRFFI